MLKFLRAAALAAVPFALAGCSGGGGPSANSFVTASTLYAADRTAPTAADFQDLITITSAVGTAVPNRPTTGVATYKGIFYADRQATPGSATVLERVAGDLLVEANFGTNRVTADVKNLARYQDAPSGAGPAKIEDLSGTVSMSSTAIDSNNFFKDGDVSGTLTNGAGDVSEVSATAAGRFALINGQNTVVMGVTGTFTTTPASGTAVTNGLEGAGAATTR